MKKLWIAISVSMIPTISVIFIILIIVFAVGGQSDNSTSLESCQTTEGGVTDLNFNKDHFVKTVQERGNAFSDKADKIISESDKAGVSPILFVSIMAHESSWGTSSAIRNNNNPSGQMNSSGIISYATLDEGIEATGRTLHNLVIERKLDTVEKLGSVYCPVGADNDPTGLNKNWVPTVKDMMKTFSGNEDTTSLATGSGGCSINDIGVTGEKMNYFDDMFELAKLQLGKPYVLGADISSIDPLSFDCGAFTLWLFQQRKITVKFNRIAQNQYDNTRRINDNEVKAGDLIFFHSTYDTGRGEYITHVGMVISETQFIQAGGDKVQISDMNNSYYKSHFAGFGRVE